MDADCNDKSAHPEHTPRGDDDPDSRNFGTCPDTTLISSALLIDIPGQKVDKQRDRQKTFRCDSVMSVLK